MKKLMMFFMALFAVFAFSGCGKDYSGTYVGEALGENEPQTIVLDIKKAAKGYTMAFYRAEYKLKIDVQNKDKARYPNPMAAFFTGKESVIDEEHMPRNGGTGKFNYELITQITASEPSKQNIMTAVMPGTFGAGQVNFEIDKDGNILDNNGVSTQGYLTTSIRKFVKADHFTKDSIKSELQKRTIKNCELKYNTKYERFGTLEFVD